MKTVITFGTYDLFHIGHLRIINRAKNLGDKLIVGISTDELNYNKKKKYPVFSQDERLEIIKSIKGVDEVFFEESLEKKREYILKYKADILVMGDDWAGRFDEFSDICDVIYLPRTKDISTTELIDKISKDNLEKYIK
jgi:glycerol-3-phosphate cytidylyltransferase